MKLQKESNKLWKWFADMGGAKPKFKYNLYSADILYNK